MRTSCHLFALLPALLALPDAASQQTIFDLEPNATKDLATPATELVDGDMLVAFGFGGCGSGPPDVDLFRARTAPLAPGIYRHDLVDAGSSSDGELRLVGLDAIQEITIPGSYDYLQQEPLDGTGNGFVSWYGFGKSEELYVDLYASYSCRSVVSAILDTNPVTPVDLGNVSSAANTTHFVNVRAEGATVPLDLEIQVFDGEFNAIPGAGIDIAGTDPVFASNGFVDGTYYVAVSDHNLATHLPHYVVDGESRTLAGALDFPGGAACGSAEVGLDVRFELQSSAIGTISQVVTKSSPYEILWFRFEVGAGPAVQSFCAGDGSVAPCPNGNDAPAGSAMGCVNSTGRGATMMWARDREFVLEDLPQFSSALLFVGVQPATATPVGNGLLCIGAGAMRAGPIGSNLSGVASTNQWTPGLSGGLGAPGTTVYVQAAYRDSTTPSFSFTNALSVRL
ncbi:MAG: hypothetical protein AAGI22_23305 [Planctomycetota bacterium]